MSNNPEPPPDLKKMLALKRHESPPPRFFSSLPDKVLDRLQSPEPPGNETWWQRLGLDFDSKPVLVCAIGVVVCGLLSVGLIVSRRVEPPAAPVAQPVDSSELAVSPPVPDGNVVAPEAPPLIQAPPAPMQEPVVVPGKSPLEPR